MCPFTVRVPHGLSLADFLGSMITCAVGLSRRTLRTLGVRLSLRICLEGSAPTPFNRLFRQAAAVSLLRPRVAPWGSNGILTVSAIGIAVRLSLRSRLTLIRLALIRNPWFYGVGVSRPHYRYLYLHLLFRDLQQGSRLTFVGYRNAPLPIYHSIDSTASATDLCPIIIHAGSLD